LRYALAFGIFATALLVRFLLLPVEAGYAFLTFYPAVVFGFYMCGIGPGVLLVALCSVAAYYFFIPPFWQFTTNLTGSIAIAVFLISAGMIGFIVNQLRTYSNYVHELFDKSASGMVAIDPSNGRIVIANLAAQKMWGYSAEEFEGKTVADLTYPDDLADSQQLNQQLKKMLTDHLLLKKRYIRKDGSIFWAETIAAAMKDLNGKAKLFIGSSIDITERIKIEEALLESEKRYRRLLEDQTEIICRYKKDGAILYVNEAFCRLFDMNRDALIGQKWQPIVLDEDVSLIMEKLNTLSPENPVVTIENRVLTAGGVIRWGQFVNRAFFDEQDRLLELQSVGRDITEQKKMQNELQQLTNEQQAMLDNELVGIIKAKDRRILWSNKAMQTIFGYDLEELNGQSTRILYTDNLSYETLGLDGYPTLKDQGVYRKQLEMLRKNGEKIWVDFSGVSLPGEEAVSLWMLLDITQLMRQQEQLETIAYHDILTGLPNRLLVSDRLTQALAQTERSGKILVVGYLDLDDFKPINDSFGHEAGDKVLIEIARRMQETVRVNDTVARVGGDEFVFLLTNLENAEEYHTVLQRVIEVINLPIMLDEANEVKVGASIGITVFPLDSDDPDILLRHADQAMYQAKQSGRNRVSLFDPNISKIDI
jgi:diguanylate cyclase (GGDEF)-like protein/PAS domain S-box-containing protein